MSVWPLVSGIKGQAKTKIFPNPSVDGVLFIDTEEEIEEIILVDMLGQIEHHYAKKLQTNFKGLVDVMIITKKGTANTKIVLQ